MAEREGGSQGAIDILTVGSQHSKMRRELVSSDRKGIWSASSK